jgi:hypothetical protein
MDRKRDLQVTADFTIAELQALGSAYYRVSAYNPAGERVSWVFRVESLDGGQLYLVNWPAEFDELERHQADIAGKILEAVRRFHIAHEATICAEPD